eukprot:scaffold25405_cov33-Tisochrysis_lutea.AAC.7
MSCNPHRHRSPYRAIGMCAVGAWLAWCMWQDMLANKMLHKYKYEYVILSSQRFTRISLSSRGYSFCSLFEEICTLQVG